MSPLYQPQRPLPPTYALPDDRRDQLNKHRTPVMTPSESVPVWRIIREMATRHPNRPAVRRNGEITTYSDLWSQVEVAAGRLSEIAVTPGALIAICEDPSVALVVWMLATHRAGCAYLPLDTAIPVQRIADILDDARCEVVIVDGSATDIVAAANERQVIDIRDVPPDAISMPEPEDKLDDIAYVIYTSGSTGRPKGVLVPQRGLLNHCTGVIDAFGLQSSDRVMQFASPSFDVAAEEIFPTLTAGATLVLRDNLVVAPSALCDLAATEDVSVLNLPTSYWTAWVKWLHSAECGIPETVRLVIIGGEEVLPSAVKQWFDLGLPDVRLINAYGPTETTISPVLGEVHPADIENGQRVPIGLPLPNIGALVVDEHDRPVADGVPGELLLSGPCVAKGYIGQPEKTDAVFSGDDPAARTYRTGDIVRWRPDGKLEFIGRNDNQIQVRGFRVEPSEIETRLLASPAIGAAAVVCEDAGTERASLTGWVSAAGGQEVDPAEIRSWLANSLPYYMVPDRIRVLPALPITTSGKIDRKKLLSIAEPGQAFGPESPVGFEENALADIWRSILNIDTCDRSASFIDQGGHSIIALEVIEKAGSVFESPPSLDSLLSDTLAQVAGGLRLKSDNHRIASGETTEREGSKSVSPSKPRTIPLLVGDASSPVYAVYYEAPVGVTNRGAALICPPYGHEYVRTHRAITRLCESLARAGCHALKFDYFGTGDSAGDSGAGDIRRWINDIQDAADELRRRSGADTPNIVGLRFGAMIAMATPINVGNAIWVDPIVDGQSYVESLEQLECSLRELNESLVIPGKATDLVGMPWPATLRTDIRRHSVAKNRGLTFGHQCCILSSDVLDATTDEILESLGEPEIVRPNFETPWTHLDSRAEELISRDVIAGIVSRVMGKS